MRFDGKVAFVTGGAIGFGREFARALAAEGASIAIADIDLPAAEKTVLEFEGSGARAMAVPCDVTDDEEVERAVQAVTANFGGIDILLNNAGKHLSKYNQPFGALARHEVRALFDVNVMGVINCSLSCRDIMRERGGGSIVSMASISGHTPTTPYGVSKLAVRGLTIAFATEFADAGIRVNAVSPGLMGTESALADLPQATMDALVNQHQLIHRLITTGDVVPTVMFLCSDEASVITGQTIMISGGYPLGI
jgi:NAD(P)-dependent dehydrogenase (short-subunit alcohol dehydrogenase family)